MQGGVGGCMGGRGSGGCRGGAPVGDPKVRAVARETRGVAWASAVDGAQVLSLGRECLEAVIARVGDHHARLHIQQKSRVVQIARRASPQPKAAHRKEARTVVAIARVPASALAQVGGGGSRSLPSAALARTARALARALPGEQHWSEPRERDGERGGRGNVEPPHDGWSERNGWEGQRELAAQEARSVPRARTAWGQAVRGLRCVVSKDRSPV